MLRSTMRCWAEISLENLGHNYRGLRQSLPDSCQVMGVVKANAYGHGAGSIGRAMLDLGVDCFGVACLNEAIELRQGGITVPILILGYTDVAFAEELHLYGLTQTVYDFESAASFSAWAAAHDITLPVHVKVDTGMSRLGLLCTEETQSAVAAELGRMAALPGLRFDGIFTHLASADCEREYTLTQLTRFFSLLELLRQEHITFPIRHCEASAAVVNYPWAQTGGDTPVPVPAGMEMNLVRTGIALFGHGSDAEVAPESLGLKPVMSLYARVAQVAHFPAGSRISYGGTYTLTRPSRVATLSIGYADGYSRGLSNRHYVMLHGKKAPILGRVCMDMCMVDVTDIPEASKGDAAEIFGNQLPLEAAAKTLHTIPYEIMCALSPRVTRVYR